MNPKKMRLSPSGPFLEDKTSNDPLQVGPGSPGLMWRAQGSASAEDVVTSGASPVVINMCDAGAPLAPGASLPWALPKGYRYDVQVDAAMKGTTVSDVRCQVLGSTDGGATFPQIILDQTIKFAPAAGAPSGGGTISFNKIDRDHTAIGPMTHVQLLMHGSDACDPKNTALRITQYVL